MRAIRSISSVRSLASIDTVTHSVTLRSRSCSCSTLTSLASVNNLLRKVMAHDVQHWSNQRSEIQQRFPAQMWFLDDLYISRIRRQHPNGNLQTPSGGIQHCDRAVSSLGFADDLNAKAAKRMEWIENTNLLGFCAQGIVSVVASILTFTCSSPPEACLRTGSPGSIPNIHFFSFPTLLCRISSALT